MPAPSSPKKASARSSGGKKQRGSGGPPREVIIRLDGPNSISGSKKKPRSSSSNNKNPFSDPSEDDVLQKLLKEELDLDSEVSSLAGSAKETMLAKKRQQQKQRHDSLEKVLLLSDDGEDEEDNKGVRDTMKQPHHQPTKSVESPGLLAARERYKSQTAPTQPAAISRTFSHADTKNSSTRFHVDSDSQEIVQGPTGMEEISLGHQHSTGGEDDANEVFEVIDIEALVESRKSQRHAGSDETSHTASSTEDKSNPYVINVVEPSSPTKKRKDSNKINKKPRPKPEQQIKASKEKTRREHYTDEKSVSSSVSSESEDDDDDNKSTGTKDLLAQAHERVAIQTMKSEMEQMQDVISKKNEELEILAGQLRRAVETKCDLVLAHTEMERHHEHDIQQKESETQQLLKANFGLMEGSADVERDLLNEIVRLKVELEDVRKQHVQELQDWERMHQNEMLERDCELARMKEEQRKVMALQKTESCSQQQVQTVHKYHGYVGV